MLTSEADGARPAAQARVRTRVAVLLQPHAVVVAATGLALLVRLYYLVPAGSFPLNDGGLFYAMARDLQANGFVPPAATSYNGDGIPFAYPLFMVYVIALLDRFTPLDLVTSLRVLPLVASVATVPAVYLLARKVLPAASATASVVAFALLVEGFHWHIMGGGITRAFGLLFAVLAVHQAWRLIVEGRREALLAAIALASLAQLSHPNMFAPVAIGLILALHGRSRPALRAAALLAAGVLVATALWWGPVVARDGLGPFVALRASRFSDYFYHDGYPWRALIDWSFTSQPLLNWPAALAVVGAGTLITRGAYLVPVWVVAEFVVEPTQAHNFLPVPVALLVGAGVGLVVLPMLARPQPSTAVPPRDIAVRARRGAMNRWIGMALVTGFFATVALWSALSRDGLPALRSLAAGEQADLAWIARETPPDARFVVVSGELWWADGLSEWFPALTERHSAYTAQGYEWLGTEFPNRIYWHDRLQGCGQEDAACLDDIVVRSQASYDYVYVRGSCCGELRDSILSSPRFEVLRQGAGGLIARVGRGIAAR
ncbi:MAG: hypothetical protein AB7I38_09720 [Dehalococcoidia bacterium]